MAVSPSNPKSSLLKMTTPTTKFQSLSFSQSANRKLKEIKDKTISMKRKLFSRRSVMCNSKRSLISTSERRSFVDSIKNLKLVKGMSSSVIHKDSSNLASDLLDFTEEGESSSIIIFLKSS